MEKLCRKSELKTSAIPLFNLGKNNKCMQETWYIYIYIYIYICNIDKVWLCQAKKYNNFVI